MNYIEKIPGKSLDKLRDSTLLANPVPIPFEENIYKPTKLPAGTGLTNFTDAEKSTASNLVIIESTASIKELGNDFIFRSWTYVIVAVKLSLEAALEEVYIDIGCGVTLIDRAWLSTILPNTTI